MALNVVIIGGSLAGLMHGIMLKRLGHNTCILEQNLSSVRESQAAGITAGPHLQAFLKYYDTYNTPWFSFAPGVKVLDKASRVRIHRDIDIRNTSWDVLYYRMRALFDGYISEYCTQPSTPNPKENGKAFFEHGKQVTSVRQTESCVTVGYRDLLTSANHELTVDLVIVAGGASCNLRSLLLPESDLQRPYSGYITWRGTVVERDVSEEARRVLGQENTLYIGDRHYIVVYIIPGVNGTLEIGDRIINIAWYCNCAEDGLIDILTDIDGHKHRYSLPSGKMRNEVWERQKAVAEDLLPPPFFELINKIDRPFVTVISDTAPSKASFFDGRLLLVGDVLTLFRPHNALSSNQAAFDCLQSEKMLQGEINVSEWETRVLQYAKLNRLRSISWGAYFQIGWLAYLKSEMRFRSEMVFQWLRNWWDGREL